MRDCIDELVKKDRCGRGRNDRAEPVGTDGALNQTGSADAIQLASSFRSDTRRMDEKDLEHLVDVALKAGLKDPIEIAEFVRDWLTIVASSPSTNAAEASRSRLALGSTHLH